MLSIINELGRLLSGKCELHKNCQAYQADSWYCNEDSGIHCGKFKKAQLRKNNKDRQDDHTRLKVIFQEPRELTA